MNEEGNASFRNTSNFLPLPPPPRWLIVLPENQKMVFTLCYSLLLAFSVLSNVYVIAIVLRNKQMRTTINYLIVNMALSDLVGSIAAISPTLSFLHNMSFQWMVGGSFGIALCKIAPFTRDVTITVSILSMTVISFDRFFAVVFPMSPTPRLLDIRFAMPMVWFIPIASFCTHLVTFTLVPVMPDIYMCGMIWPKNFDQRQSSITLFLVILVLYFCLPFIIVTCLYITIAYKIKTRAVPGQHSEETERKRRKQNHGIMKIAFLIVMCFFGCWFPYHVLTILEVFVWKGSLPPVLVPHYKVLSEVTVMLSYLTFFINPLICLIFSSNFRKCLKGLFPFYLCYGRNKVGTLMNSSLPRNETSLQPSSNRTILIAMNAVGHKQEVAEKSCQKLSPSQKAR